MRIKYLTISSENPTQDVLLLTSVLGFNHTGTLFLGENIHCRLFRHEAEDRCLALLTSSGGPTNLPILSTDNCKKSYLAFTRTGVKFSSPPITTGACVVAEFTDTFGNRFILLEERVATFYPKNKKSAKL